MRGQRLPARSVKPGYVLSEEMEERGWSQVDFAERTNLPVSFVGEIIDGEREITSDIAAAIASALGTSSELWLNLESAYRQGLVHGRRMSSVSRSKPDLAVREERKTYHSAS
jgi:addiction module HigA family antidote